MTSCELLARSRTKDLVEVVIQLNAVEGFMALSTFHTDKLEVYPIIFIDPTKVSEYLLTWVRSHPGGLATY